MRVVPRYPRGRGRGYHPEASRWAWRYAGGEGGHCWRDSCWRPECPACFRWCASCTRLVITTVHDERREWDASLGEAVRIHEVVLLPAADAEKLYQKVKAAPKRRAREGPLRVAAELPETTRKITVEVSVVGQGVGTRGRGPRDAWREWCSGRMSAARSCTERDCGRTSAEK